MSEPSKSPTLSDRYWRLPWLARIGVVIGGFIAVAALFGVVNRTGVLESDRPTRTGSTSDNGVAGASPAALPGGQIGSGDWLVGSDVTPGTYRSAGPAEPEGYCMWSRRNDASGELFDGSIIASNGTYDAGPMLVTIEPSDVVFRTRGCAPFTPVG